MALLIAFGTILMVMVMGLGFQRRAYAGAVDGPRSGDRPAIAWLVLLLLSGWLAFAIALGVSGFFVTGPGERVPRVGFALIPLLIGGALFTASPTFRRTIGRTPTEWLVGVQAYRLEGSVFLIGYSQGLFPGVFALPAGWGDVLIGLTAPIVAWLLWKRHPWSRRIAVLWNIAGIIDLVLAVTLGVLSAPGPFQRLSLGTPNTVISTYPFILIPTVLVPLSILLHVFSLQNLRYVKSPNA